MFQWLKSAGQPALEILIQIYQATQKVMRRFELINSADDFTDSEAGMEKLDAICMQLIAIGESLKNLVKVTDHKLLPSYPEVDWKKANQTNIKNTPLLCELCESINF